MTILFSTTDRLISRLIRLLSGGAASHCAVGFVLHGRNVVVESSLLGVEMVARDRWLRSNRIIAEVDIPADDAPHPATFIAQLGEGYDYSGMIGYLPVFVARWLRRRIRNPWASPTRVVCTELIVRAMQARKRSDLWDELDPEHVYPEDILSICKASCYPSRFI